MQSKTTSALCLTAALGLTACAVTTSRESAPQERTAPSGTREKIAYFYYLATNCQPQGIPQITVTKIPANGTVTLGSGDDLPQYTADNPRAACNQQPVGSAEVFYQSGANFHGTDDFSIQVRYSSTFTETFSYHVTVN